MSIRAGQNSFLLTACLLQLSSHVSFRDAQKHSLQFLGPRSLLNFLLTPSSDTLLSKPPVLSLWLNLMLHNQPSLLDPSTECGNVDGFLFHVALEISRTLLVLQPLAALPQSPSLVPLCLPDLKLSRAPRRGPQVSSLLYLHSLPGELSQSRSFKHDLCPLTGSKHFLPAHTSLKSRCAYSIP